MSSPAERPYDPGEYADRSLPRRALISYQRRLYHLEALQPDVFCPSPGDQRKLLAQPEGPMRL